MIRRIFLSLLGNTALATLVLSSTSASAILSLAGASLLLASTVPAKAQTATVHITTAGTLETISVLTQGATGLDYVAPPVQGGSCASGTAYSVGDSCTVQYSFTATHPWMRYGGISLFDASHNRLGTAFLNEMGSLPQVSYPLSNATVPSSIGSGFSSPTGVAIDGSGNVYVADAGEVKELMAVGGVVPANPTTVTWKMGFTSPIGVAVDGSGNIYVADTGSVAILELVAQEGGVVSPMATPVSIGSGFSSPTGVAVDGSGNVYVADAGNHAIKEIVVGADGLPATTTPQTLYAAGSSSILSGIAVDGTGNVYFTDGYSTVVEELAIGASTPATLSTNFDTPSGVAVDGSGNVYVADKASASILELLVQAGGGVSTTPTILGSGFKNPAGVAVDASGNVFVADTGNNLAKEMNAQTPPTLAFKSTMVGYKSSDSPQTLTVANNGNAPLLFAVPTTGGNPSVATNFSLSSTSTCPQLTSSSSEPGSLAAGASCTDVVSFSPTQAGPLTGSLTTTDSALGSPRSVSLTGTGTPAPTNLTLAPLTGSTGVDQSVTFTATVAATGAVPPTGGTVTFTVTIPGSAPTSEPPVTQTSGTSFQFTYTPTDVGSFSVTAAYHDPNSNFMDSTSAQGTVLVTQGNASVAVSETGSATYGGPASFTAAVSSTGAGHVVPSGSVTFSAASTAQPTVVLCTSATLTAGSASCPITALSLPAGSYTITAAYSGNSKFLATSSNLTGVTVAKATPAVTLGSSVINPASPVVNQRLTFTTGVSNIPTGGGALTGTFTFTTTLNGAATTLCSAVPVSSSSCTTSLAAGSNVIAVSYSGDTNFSASTATLIAVPLPTLTVAVVKGGTQLALSPSSGASVVNQLVTLTATLAQTAPATGTPPLVGSIAPTGTVAFASNSVPIAGCGNQVLISGSATCTTGSLAVGTADSITAAYTPVVAGVTDPNFNSGNSVAAVTQTVNMGTPVITLNNPATSIVNQTVTFTATASQLPPASGTVAATPTFLPTGAVTFTLTPSKTSTPAATCTVSGTLAAASQSVTCATQALMADTYSVVANYAGDPNFKAAAQSTATTQTVSADPMVLSVVPASATVIAQQPTPATFTVTLTPQITGPIAPKGQVTFAVTGGDQNQVVPTCSAFSIAQPSSPSYVATCSPSFSTGSNNAFTLKANYAETGTLVNFLSTGPVAASITVQDFTLTQPSTSISPAGVVYVTQGYSVGGSSPSDPIFSLANNVLANSLSQYAGTIAFTGCLDTGVPPVPAGAPTCTQTGTSVAVPPGGSVGVPVSIATSSQTTPGDYTYTLTETGSSGSPIQSVTFDIRVAPQTTVPAIVITAAETVAAPFVASAPSDTFTFACPATAYDVTTSQNVGISGGSQGPLYCAPAVSSGPLQSNTASFVVGNPQAVTQAQLMPLRPGVEIATATICGLPFLAFAGWFGRKKSFRDRLVRLLGAIALIACLSQTIGCGSNGFTGQPSALSSGTLSAGNYLIQVSATDMANGQVYYSVLNLQIAP